MGRPTFKIDCKRLRRLRDEKGMTQLSLAMEASRLLGTAKCRDNATLISDYQRIERKGRTSRKTASALAAVLEVSVEVLQGIEGPEPSDYLERIKKQLQKQFDKGATPSLIQALKHEAESDPDDALASLAEQIGERIETAQLGRNPSAIADLCTLTGLSESELLAPANVIGHWFVTVTSRICNRSDIIYGVSALGYHVKELVGSSLNHFGSDGVIQMWRDKPWFRLEIVRPRINDRMRIDFVRCQSDANGLRWIDSSWRDDFFIESDLINWAYSAANFVSDFSGKSAPGDLHRLRLRVTEHDGPYRQAGRQMIISRHFEEMPETVKENFKRESESHHLFVSWLVADLRRALALHLRMYPAQCWRVSGSACIDIHFTEPRFAPGSSGDLRYRISLVEEISTNEFVPVPWREIDKAKLREKIEDWLREGLEHVTDTELLPCFKPI
jgi:transcriptional regulator with XRE-family HTH domain